MRKLITIILVLATSVAFGQTTYQLNYDSIRVGKTAGNGATSLYGKTYLKNATEGTPSDSVLTVRNGRVYKIAGSAISSVGFLTYVFSRTASDISGYEQMPALTSYTAGAADTAILSATTTPAIIQEFATNTGFPNTTLIPAGVFNVSYQTQKNSGSNNYYTYAVIYKRSLAGSETVIANTANSTSTSANTVQSVSVSAIVSSDISLLTTDRIIVKVFGVMVTGTANISLFYDDATDAKLQFPSALVDATNFVPYNGATKDVNLSTYDLTADTLISNDNISKFPLTDVRAYASISAAVTAIGSSNATLLIPNAQAVSASDTIPSNITLKVLQGGVITIASGQVLTINGSIDAGLYQIFAGSGTVTLQRGSSSLAYPEWWYTGSGSWHTAINSALTATAEKGIPVQLSGKEYATSGTITVGNDNVLQGVQGRYTATVINYSGAAEAVTVKDAFRFGTVKRIAITGGTTATAIGILVGRPYTLLEDIFIYDFDGLAGIKVTDSASTSGGYLSRINRVIIYGNAVGVAALGDLKFGIWLSSQANAVTVSDYSANYVGTSGGAGLYVDGGVGINIDNVNIENGYSGSFTVHGILLNGGSDINLHNPYFENNNKNLVVNNGSGIIVDNIYVNGFGQSSVGIQVNNPASYVTIRGGSIASVSGSGTDLELVSSPSNVVVQNLKTEDTNYTGTPLVNLQSSTKLNFNGTLSANSALVNGAAQNLSALTPKFQSLASAAADRMNGLVYFGNDANSPILGFGKSRSGTVGTLTYPGGSDFLGRIFFMGANEATSRFDVNANIDAIATSNWSATNREAKLEFYTTPSGATARQLSLDIAGSGAIKLPNLAGTGTRMVVADNVGTLSTQAIPSGAGGGTVTTVSVNNANGFAGTSSGGATPALTLSTTVNSPVLAGNGTAISAATTTGSGSTVVLSTSPTLVTPNLGTPSTLVGTNITGTASGLTAGAITGQANSATITAATASTINTIALRDANGDIAARTYIMNPAYGDFAPNKLVGTSVSGQIREMSQAQAQSYLGLGSNAYTSTVFTSGTYTPSTANISNTSSSTGYLAQYMRIGNVVTVSGQVLINASSSGTTEISMTLPISSSFVSTIQASGTANDQGGAGIIKSIASTSTVSLKFTSPTSGAYIYVYQYSYQII